MGNIYNIKHVGSISNSGPYPTGNKDFPPPAPIEKETFMSLLKGVIKGISYLVGIVIVLYLGFLLFVGLGFFAVSLLGMGA